jgi:hypothetical protein
VIASCSMRRYGWLSALAISFSVASYFCQGWLSGFLSNLGAGFVGSVLTVFLIDRAIERSNLREKIRVRRVAFDRLRPVLLSHILFLFNLHKASATKEPDAKPIEIQDMFDEEYYGSLGMLDFNMPGPTLPRAPWVYFAAHQAETFRNSLQRMADMYIAFLDTESIEIIEILRSSIMLHLLVSARDIPAADHAAGFDRKVNPILGGAIEYLKDHIGHLMVLVTQFNKYATKPISITDFGVIWRNDIAPPIGSARMNL